jgi:hypothetical protein
MAISSTLLNPGQDEGKIKPPGSPATRLPANDPPLELYPPRACPAEISPGLDELVEREFADVYLLIDHLSGRADRKVGTIELEGCPEPGQKANLIDQVCQVRWPASGDQPKPANQAAVLFKARDKLSELAAPATGLTVAYTLLVAPGRCGKAELARKAYPHLVEHAKQLRRWLRWLLGIMITGIVLTSLASWYVGYGKLVLSRIDQLDTQRSEITAAFDTLEGLNRTSGQAIPSRGTPSEAWMEDEADLINRCDRLATTPLPPNGDNSTRLIRACEAAHQLDNKRIVADQALDEWGSYWWWLPHSAWALGVAHVEGKGAAANDIAVVERKEQWSSNLLAILGNYALPMMYGLLGAAAAAMMNVNQKIRSSRLSPRDRRMSQVQLVLGVITGGCIGLFLTPSGAGTTTTPLSGGGVAFSASALSFLAGFGVEGVFKMVQNILVTVFGDQPHMSSARPSA